MSQGRIDDFVSPKGFEQLDELLSKLGITREAINGATADVLKFNNAIAGSRSMQEYATNTAAASAALDKVEKSVEKTRLAEIRLQQAREKNFDDYEKQLAKQQSIQEKAEAKDLARIQKLQAAQEKANAKITFDSQKKQSQVDKESKAFSDAEEKKNIALAKTNRAFNLLNQRYQDAIKNAKDIGAAQGSTSQAFIDATEHANKLGKQIDGINTPLGDFKNKVGGYTEGIANYFRKAFGFLRQAAYILPGIGIAGIFNLAGEAIISLADKLDIFNSKVSQSAKNQRALNDINEEADKKAGEQITHLKYLYDAATDVNNSIVDRKLAVNELQKEFPNYFKNISDETILNGGAKKSYDELSDSIIENARALAAAGKIAELRGKILDTDIQKAKILGAESNEAIKLAQDIKSGKYDLSGTGEQGGSDILADNSAKKSHDRAVKAIKDQDDLKKGYEATIKVIEKVVGGGTKIGNALANNGDNTPKTPKAADNKKQLYEEQLKALKLAETAVLQSSKSSYEQRLGAVQTYYTSAYDLTKKYSDKQVLSQIETNNKLVEIELDTTKDKVKINEDAQKELATIFKEGIKLQEDGERASIELIQNAGDDKILIQQQNAADALQALAQQYRSGLITQKEYLNQVTAIEDQADIDKLDQEIITAQAIIDVRKGLLAFGIGSAKELQTAEDKLAAAKLARTKAGTKAVMDGIKDEAEARKQLHDKEKELASASINLIQTVVDANYQKQITALQEISKKIDENANNEKEKVNNSLLSAKEKARQTSIIDAQTAQQQQQLAEQEKRIKTEQAKFDRAIAIARIIEETAVAVVSSLKIPVVGIALAAVVGALGAVQLATVLATPLPQFEKGGTVKKDGPIITGEAGTELRIDPTGKMSLTDDFANVSYAKAGTKIINNQELVKMLGKPEHIDFIASSTNDNRKMEKLLGEINTGIKQQKRPVVNFHSDKFGDYSRRRNY